MLQFTVKLVVSGLIIATAAELAKRSSFLGALLVSLPLTSLLTFIVLYLETGDTQKIAQLSHTILWLILPSLLLFIVFPFLLRSGINFWLSLLFSCVISISAYFIMLKILHIFNVNL